MSKIQRKPEQMKEQIISYLEEAKVKNTLIDIEEKGLTQLLFSIQAGEQPAIAIYVMKNFPDRIIIQGDIFLSPEHQKLTQKMNDGQFNQFVVNLQDKLTSYNVRHRFFIKEKTLEQIRLHLFFHEANLDRDTLLQNFVRIQEVVQAIINMVNITLGVSIQTPKEPGDSLSYVR